MVTKSQTLRKSHFKMLEVHSYEIKAGKKRANYEPILFHQSRAGWQHFFYMLRKNNIYPR
jgi:hypothetical protein